ncbi:MAG: hypothetical protein DRG59_10125 [Deltaproteobacteria bacterium]|nr:MAG: hypothetical protein DRG59_10125 [Deltaproteobacteria bacterium]
MLACDDDGICADWVQYNAVTPNIKLDATAPPGLGALTYDSKTSISVTLSFGASTTEENFSEYRIYYKEGSSGVTESDIEHSDANLDYIDYNGSTTTTITNLSPSTQYVFNIWVYDLAGNKASSTEVTVTTNTTHSINQQSYLLENDDGSDVNSNTSEVSADTALTNVNKGQRINARIQIQNSGGDQTYYKAYKLQYEQTDEPGNWIDVGATAAISYSYGLSGSNNDVITSFKAATNSYTWSNGSWHENTYLTGTYNLFASYYTEFVFAIKTNNVELGKTYRLRLFNNTDGIPLDSYNSYPTITIASSETKRYSKSNLSSLPSSTSDLTYYFDAEGYSDVNADDNTNRDEIISSSNYPIVLFATKHTGNTDAITTTWNGQSTMAPTSASVVMQVYRFGSTNAWVTVASNATSSADSDFTISGNINSDLSEYYDGSYWTYWLIYQNSGSQTLKTDYFNVSFAPPVANVGQIHYRWRNDDGDEAGASWREAEDVGDPTTGTALEKGVNVRLRLSTANIGGGNASNYAYKLEYASTAGNCSTDPGGWTAVPINYTGSEHFEMSTSTWFTNGTSTVARMINSENYTFINGTMTEDPSSTSSAITLAEDEYSEIEYVFKATATSTTGGTYCFRLTNNGSDLNYYDEYAEITLSGFSNSAPSFTVQPSDSGSASTTPTNNGDDINFTATASDAEGDDYYLAICKTNSITAGNNTPPNCNDGDWCISNVASSTVQANCSYTTDLPAFESRDWYAFVCDRRSGAGVSQCSSYSQGEISIASGSPFNINHAPSFTSISTQNDNQDPGSSFTITTISSDSDTEGGNDTLYLYVCRTNDATFSDGCSDDTVCSVTATSSPNATCYYNDIAPTLSGSYTYYAFIFDNHGMAATTNSQINSYTINNIKPVLGTLILNNGNDITLNIKGAADVQISASTTVSDQNGCIDLVSATAVIYMSNATNTYNCTGDYNDCYHINTSSCVKSDCIDDDDFTAVYTCTANIKYFAIPTDNSINNPWEPYNWLSRVIVYDGTYYEAATSSSVELISSIALNVAEETINYGTIGDNNDTGSINATTTIVNYGNTPINNNLYGIDMNRVPAGIISVDNQEYNLSPFVWGSGNDLATSSSLVDIIVPKPTSSDDVYDEIYWGIGIPLDTPPGDYSGNNTFSALLDQNGW